jgi:hypothetical protein
MLSYGLGDGRLLSHAQYLRHHPERDVSIATGPSSCAQVFRMLSAVVTGQCQSKFRVRLTREALKTCVGEHFAEMPNLSACSCDFTSLNDSHHLRFSVACLTLRSHHGLTSANRPAAIISADSVAMFGCRRQIRHRTPKHFPPCTVARTDQTIFTSRSYQ